MKRMFFGLLITGACFLLRVQDTHALTYPGNEHPAEIIKDEASCLKKDSVDFPEQTIFVSAIIGDPKNPIVIGQDKDMRGVDLTVTVTSVAGKAVYHNWVMREVGNYYLEDGWIPAGMNCNQPRNGRMWCYRLVGECTETEETVYRRLWPERTHVWLDPSKQTRDWLRWSGTATGDPLRFVFPDDWGLGAWTPEGVKKKSNPGSGSEWWTFLYGDPMILSLPNTNMEIVSEPTQTIEEEGYSTNQMLGLWGTFSSFPGQPTFTGIGNMDQCLIDDEVTENASKKNDGPSKGKCFYNPGNASSTSQVTTLTIRFYNIPLDLPGKWRIGMTANQYPALYANGTRDERNLRKNINEYTSLELRVGPCETGYKNNCYNIDDYTFMSYIIISTPCYNADPYSCIN